MPILEPGNFNVADYRKNIPVWVKLAVMIRQRAGSTDGNPFQVGDASTIQFDHDPALTNRPYDTGARDFVPPQNDPAHIYAKRKGQHLEKTTGRKEGAERTVTTRGSDVGEAARTIAISDSEAIHQAKIASKNGDYKAVTEILSTVKRKRRLIPKKKIQSRGFSPEKRPMKGGNAFQRWNSSRNNN